MARRKHKSRTQELRSRSPEDLERYAKSKLDAGKPRQAREAYKELVRLDPLRYTPGLLVCYLAQARQMAQVGQLTEAARLLDTVRELDSSGQFVSELAECEALIAGEQGSRKAGKSPRRAAAGRAAAQSVAVSPADAAVCLGEIPESGEEPFTEDLARIRSALEAVTRSDFDAAVAQVRPIGVGSEFSNWKLLVRGMVAFYRGDDTKCLANFDRISADSAASCAAAPYRVLLDGSGKLVRESSHKERLVADACRVAGQGRIAEDLARAEYLWMAGRYRDAYRRLRGRLSGFPSFQSDLSGVLSRVFFNLPHHLDPPKADAYVTALQREMERGNGEPHPIELYLMTRTVGLLQGGTVGDEEDCALLEQYWEMFIDLCRRMLDEDKQLEGEVHAFIGRQCSQGVKPEHFLFPFGRPRRQGKESVFDAERGEKHLLKSLELDPENRATWMQLLDAYERTGRKAERNRTLDRAIERFPKDKEILHKAALLCFERSAHTKGLGYLERAHELDPLDRGIRATLTRRYVTNAAAALSRRRTKQMRELMDRAEAVSEEQTRAYELGRRYVLARRAAMEDRDGNRDSAHDYLTRAFGEAPSPLEISYFALLACQTYHGSRALAADLERRVTEQLKADAGMPAVATMVSVLTYMLHNEQPREHERRAERERMSGLATRAAKGAFVRQAAVTIARYAVDIDDLGVAKRYAAAGLRADSEDPFFRVLERIGSKPFHFKKLMEWMQRMRKLQLKARERNDQEAVALAQQALSKAEASAPIPLGLYNPFLEGLDDGVFDDDDDFDEPPPRRRRGRGKRKRISEGDLLEPF